MKTKNEINDYKRYFIQEGEEGFSPERNKAMIEQSIKEYELKRKLQSDAFTDALKERVDVAVSYLFSVKSKTKDISEYVSRQYLAYLQGQRIIQKAKRLMNGKEIITLEEVA